MNNSVCYGGDTEPAVHHKSPVPREHGAWAMLLQPFLGAIIVLRRFDWELIPAFAAVVLVFLIREPIVTLARQRLVWRTERPETAVARRYLMIELALLAIAGAVLLFAWPVWILVALGGSAAALTALAVWMTVRNRQRAVWFQAVSAAGLASSALAACLAVSLAIPAWAWWFWGLHAAHFLAAILVVHVRLEARIAARKSVAFAIPRDVLAVQWGFAVAGVALIAIGKPLYGAAALLSSLSHLYDLRRLRSVNALSIPMKQVGVHALMVSIAFTLLVIAGSFRGLLY